MPDLGKLGLKFENAAVIFEISTFELMKSEILINAVNFATGVASSEDPGSSFSEGPVRDLCPLYKVCLIYMLER